MDNSDINIDVIIPPSLQPILNILPLPIALYNSDIKAVWQNSAFVDLQNSIDSLSLNNKFASFNSVDEEKFCANNVTYKLSKIKLLTKSNAELFFICLDKDTSLARMKS